MLALVTALSFTIRDTPALAQEAGTSVLDGGASDSATAEDVVVSSVADAAIDASPATDVAITVDAQDAPAVTARIAAPTVAPSAGTGWSNTPVRTMSVVGAPGRGVTLQTNDDFFALTLRGRAQVRETVNATSAGVVTNELNLRTIRLLFLGHVLSRNLQYNLQLALAPQDFEPNTVSPVFDAWLAINFLRDLQIRVGQFFVPFDRARTNAEWGLQLIDRPLVVGEATLDRDVGVEFSSNNLGGLGVLAYRLGVFGGEGKNRLASSPGFLYTARFQVNPMGNFDDSVEGDQYRTPRPRLALGIAGAFNHQAQRQRSTQGNTYALGTFDYVHAAADATFKFRGLYLFAEAVYRQGLTDRREGIAPMMTMMTTEYSRSAWGYVLQAGMMLWRNLELAARWEQLFALSPNTDPALIATIRTQGNEAGVGVNWYQDGHGFKLQLDYHYQFGENFAQGRHVTRAQLQVSF